MRAILMAFAMICGTSAWAEVPKVLTDIAPVHSLAATVMGDLGTPELLLEPGADPHHFQMRPSQARAVADADLLIWMGPALTPWLPRTLENMSHPGQMSLELLSHDSMPMRIEGAVATIQEDPPPNNHDNDVVENGEAHAHAHEGHGHGGMDPHAWLDPLNAVFFLHEIAEVLADADSNNAATYHRNAAQTSDRILALTAQIGTMMAPHHRAILIPYHDAYRYFFARFDLQMSGGVTPTDAAPPGAAHLTEMRNLISANYGACVFGEIGVGRDLIDVVTDDPDRVLSSLDPLGATLTPGPALYEALIMQMAQTIDACASH